MEFYIAFSAGILFIGFWNLMIAVLGLFPKFQSTALGTLEKATTRRNVQTRYGHRIPILTRYAYTYTVKGKKYRYTGEELHSKRHLLPKVSMVFVKGFPHRAYPNKFKGTTEWAVGLSFLAMGTLYIIMMALP